MLGKRCDRCGLKIKKPADYCPACGIELNSSTDQYPYPNEPTSKRTYHSTNTEEPFPTNFSFVDLMNNHKTINSQTIVNHENKKIEEKDFQKIWSKTNLLHSFSWRKLIGTVIAVEPPYMTTPSNHWIIKSIKISLCLIFFPIIIAIAIAAFIASSLFAFLSFGRSNRPGIMSNITTQVISFFLTGKLFGPKEQIPVRDVRIREKNGNEHLIRISGELIAGNFNVGDEIEAQGFNNKGTLVFYRGRNYRTGSEIIVKKR